MHFFSEQHRLKAAKKLFTSIGALTNAPFTIHLWNGSRIPLGVDGDEGFFISIEGPGVIGSLLRKPTYENLLLHYAQGNIGIHGDLIDFITLVRKKKV